MESKPSNQLFQLFSHLIRYSSTTETVPEASLWFKDVQSFNHISRYESIRQNTFEQGQNHNKKEIYDSIGRWRGKAKQSNLPLMKKDNDME